MDLLPPGLSLSAYLDEAHDLLATKYYLVACTVLCFYEYALTLNDEITYAWDGIGSPVFWLFILMRYYALIMVIIINIAYFAKAFTAEICSRWVVIELVQTVATIFLSQIFMTLRVYALSRKNKKILAFFVVAMAGYLGLGIAVNALPGNTPIWIPSVPVDEFHICVLAPHSHVTPGILYYAIIFDALIFLTTLYYTISSTRDRLPSNLFQVMLRDGALSFLLIFTATTMWLILLLHARATLRFIQAEPHLILISLIVSRMSLSLKKASARGRAHVPWSLRVFEMPEDGRQLPIAEPASSYEMPAIRVYETREVHREVL